KTLSGRNFWRSWANDSRGWPAADEVPALIGPSAIAELAIRGAWRTGMKVLADIVRLGFLTVHSHTQLAAENLFLRKQLALYPARRVKPRRADDATRIALYADVLAPHWSSPLRSS